MARGSLVRGGASEHAERAAYPPHRLFVPAHGLLTRAVDPTPLIERVAVAQAELARQVELPDDLEELRLFWTRP